MYIYAIINSHTGIVEDFWEETEPLENDPIAILVNAIDETWIQRKKWDEETQQFVNVLPSEAETRNSLEFTHIDSNGTKHWLDVFVNNLASNSVETATVSEVETYLTI